MELWRRGVSTHLRRGQGLHLQAPRHQQEVFFFCLTGLPVCLSHCPPSQRLYIRMMHEPLPVFVCVYLQLEDRSLRGLEASLALWLGTPSPAPWKGTVSRCGGAVIFMDGVSLHFGSPVACDLLALWSLPLSLSFCRRQCAVPAGPHVCLLQVVEVSVVHTWTLCQLCLVHKKCFSCSTLQTVPHHVHQGAATHRVCATRHENLCVFDIVLVETDLFHPCSVSISVTTWLP